MFRISQMMHEVLSPGSMRPIRTPKAPVVIWNLIRRCNLTCRHCYTTSADIDFPGELSSEQAFSVIDDLADYGVPALILSGGEPLLRPDIFELTHYAKNKGMYVGLSSNGTLINEENINAVKAAGYDYVGISIDGNRKTHDYFRRRQGGFDDAMHGLSLCSQNDIKVGLRFTLTKDNFADLPDILDTLREFNIDKFYLSHLNYSGRGRTNRGDDAHYEMTRKAVDMLFENCLEDLSQGINREYVTGNNDADGVYFYHWVKKRYPDKAAHIKKRLLAWGGNSTGKFIANIDNVGNVHPDTFWWNYSIGNVKDKPFSQIWKNTSDPLMQAFRQSPRQLKGRCGNCSYSQICNGNTRVRAYVAYQDPLAEDPGCYLNDEEIKLTNYPTAPLESWPMQKTVRFDPRTTQNNVSPIKFRAKKTNKGKIYLVGAGPGDADLLTVKALRLIQKADVIVYDRLISSEILDQIPKTTQTVFVGKQPSNHSMSQEKINQLLIKLARSNEHVVRLKGGDPFIFGRGGEELEALADAGIPYQVIPGVSAANGCGAYSGIPLTHRDFTQSVTFVTGHSKKNSIPGIDFKSLANVKHTLVFYMGLSSMVEISAGLINAGMSVNTPAAAIQNGTTQQQIIIKGTIASLPDQAKALHTPVLIIVGEVVSLADKLSWFEPDSDTGQICEFVNHEAV